MPHAMSMGQILRATSFWMSLDGQIFATKILSLGLDGRTIWNCHLETAANDYWEKIDALAFEKSWELYSEDDALGVRDGFIPVYCSASGRLLHYTMPEPLKRPEFGGKTRSEFVNEYAEKLIREDTGNAIPIFPRFEIHKDYAYGLGLHAVLDVPVISRETIEAMITHFQSFGEQAWQDVKPVERCKLPTQTFEALLKQDEKNVS
jgi:hypothetical protein